MHLLILLLVSLALAMPVAATTIYRWVDEQGNVVFSDEPPPPGVEATRIEGLTRPTVTPPPDERVQEAVPEAVREAETPGDYATLLIASPAGEAEVRANDGNVTVSIRSEPALATDLGHAIRLRLDGREVAEGGDMQFLLQNLERGPHTVQAEIVTREGQVLKTSPLVRFHVLRHSERDDTPPVEPKPDPFKPERPKIDPFKPEAPKVDPFKPEPPKIDPFKPAPP